MDECRGVARDRKIQGLVVCVTDTFIGMRKHLASWGVLSRSANPSYVLRLSSEVEQPAVNR